MKKLSRAFLRAAAVLDASDLTGTGSSSSVATDIATTCESAAVAGAVAARTSAYAASAEFASGSITPCVTLFNIPDDAVTFSNSTKWIAVTSPSVTPPAGMTYGFACNFVFSTSKPNSVVTLTAQCRPVAVSGTTSGSASASSSVPPNASKVLVGSLDAITETDPHRIEVSYGSSVDIKINVPNPGVHFIEVIYLDADTADNEDDGNSQGWVQVGYDDDCNPIFWDCLTCRVMSGDPPYYNVNDVPCPWDVESGGGDDEEEEEDECEECEVCEECSNECTPSCEEEEAADGAVSMATGSANVSSTDFSTNASGMSVTVSRSYTNKTPSATLATNNVADLSNVNWLTPSQPRLVFKGDNRIRVLRGPKNSQWFQLINGEWVSQRNTPYTLTQNANGFVFASKNGGNEFVFDNAGLLQTQTLAGKSTVATYNYDNATGSILQNISISDGTTTETLTYNYGNDGRVSAIVFNGINNNSRRIEYTYYAVDGNNGRAGDLQTVIIKNGADANSAVLKRTYYRYYGTDDATTFPHALQYVLNSAAWDRMEAAGLDPLTATDGELATYADRFFAYETGVTKKRVTSVSLNGGSQTYTFAYEKSDSLKDYNKWKIKTTLLRPDGAVETVYSNGYAQTMLRVLKASSAVDAAVWYKGYTYSNTGKRVLTAESSAIQSVDEEVELLFKINADTGLVHENGWVAYGETKDYLQTTYVRRGYSGNNTKTKLAATAYSVHTAGGETIVIPALRSAFRDEAAGGSNAATTSTSCIFHSGTNQIKQRTTVLPAVSSAENGNDVSATVTEIFDTAGRLVWKRDGRGVITKLSYVDATGAFLQRIDDVDTTRVADAPDGWETAAGFGKHVTTDYESDFLGRTTLELGPAHTIDIGGVATVIRTTNYTVYKDTEHEVWRAAGYVTGNAGNYVFQTTSSVSIVRSDSDRKVIDIIKAPYTGSGRLSPNATFPQDTWQEWTHNTYNTASQLASQRIYFSIPATGDGNANTNYNETLFGYDSMGRKNRVQSPGGSIITTQFDVRGLPISTSEGTDDSGTASDNMVQTGAKEYDGGIAGGDGLLTTETLFEFAHGDAAVTARRTVSSYDWRNRKITETNELNVVTIFAHDNSGNVVLEEKHSDGTGGTLISKTELRHDARGNKFRELIYSVSGGSAGNAIANDSWFDENGNVIKERKAGQRVFTKTVRDGLNRIVKTFVCYPIDDSEDGPTSDVSNDLVISQEFFDYDDASNRTGAHSGERTHVALPNDAGELRGADDANPNGRISHLFSYPDAIGRIVATANYGTAGGTTPTRPDTIPSQSDNILVNLKSYDSASNLTDTIDALGHVNHREFDARRRVVQEVENFTGGTPGTDTDKTTLYTYAPDGGVATLTLKNSTTGDQTTTWQYGTTLADNGIATSYLLSLKIFPDDNAAGGSPDRIAYTYTRQQLLKTVTDQNGNVHTLGYDLHARITSDAITTLGANTDASVLRIETGYDDLNNETDVVSFDAATGGNVVNSVHEKYNSFGQLAADIQEHVGAVTTSSPALNYDYVPGINNCTTLLGTNYPSGRQIDTVFDTHLDEMTGRPGSLHDAYAGGNIAVYSYLGADTVVSALYAQPNIALTYVKQNGEPVGDGGDQYNGLDRFGRIVDQRWIRFLPESPAVDRFQYGYNRVHNRLWRANLVSATQPAPVFLDELYGYDNIFQITDRKLGQLNAEKTAIIGTATQHEDWTLDPAGNWNVYNQENTAGSNIGETRTHNAVNEILTINGSSSPVGFDPAGNMTTVPSDYTGSAVPFTTTWDAWKRLTRVQGGPNGIDIRFEYDGKHRRTRQIVVAGTALSLDFYYNDKWKVVEERVIDTSTITTGDDATITRPPVSRTLRAQYIYGVRNRNDLILRDITQSGVTTRHYVTSDAMFSTTALVTASGDISARLAYTAYGVPTFLNPDFTPAATNATDWQILLHGEYYDLDTLWSNYGFRYYSLTLGRWLNWDLLEENSGVDFFVFNENNPCLYQDAYGLLSLSDIAEFALTPGTLELTFPIGFSGASVFVNISVKPKDDKGCREIQIAVGVDWDITSKVLRILSKIPPLKKILIRYRDLLPKVRLALFGQGSGRYCCGCLDFCEVSLNGAITLGEGRRGGRVDGNSKRFAIGFGVSGEFGGSFNFCEGTFSLEGTILATVSINILGFSFNRDFEAGGTLMGSHSNNANSLFPLIETDSQKDALKVLTPCK
jgi:RHS repeat-associated protein